MANFRSGDSLAYLSSFYNSEKGQGQVTTATGACDLCMSCLLWYLCMCHVYYGVYVCVMSTMVFMHVSCLLWCLCMCHVYYGVCVCVMSTLVFACHVYYGVFAVCSFKLLSTPWDVIGSTWTCCMITNPSNFLNNVETLVKQIDSVSHINLFLTDLEWVTVLQTRKCSWHWKFVISIFMPGKVGACDTHELRSNFVIRTTCLMSHSTYDQEIRKHLKHETEFCQSGNLEKHHELGNFEKYQKSGNWHWIRRGKCVWKFHAGVSSVILLCPALHVHLLTGSGGCLIVLVMELCEYCIPVQAAIDCTTNIMHIF